MSSTRYYLLTGATSGLGLEAAAQLARADESAVIIAGARETANLDRLRHAIPAAKLHILTLDTSSLASVQSFANEVTKLLGEREARSQMERLKDFCLLPTRFIPLTTIHLERAAQLWGQARRGGRSAASYDALDADVILAAQALCLGLPAVDFIAATTNVRHLSWFVPCDEWTNINP